MSNPSLHYRGGPYCFNNSVVHGRADLTGDPAVVLDVHATFYPITVDWGDESEIESFAEGATVDHTYATDDTFTIVLTDAKGATDTFDVTIAGNV